MKPTLFVRTLLNTSRARKGTFKSAPLFALAASVVMIQYAGAVDYQYGSTTTTFDLGFTPDLGPTISTTADRLIFSGTNVSYTATDDLGALSANQVVFNGTANPIQTVTVARGAGANSITLGGTNPVLNFATPNGTLVPVIDNLDYTYAANGFITKSFASGNGQSNPILNGAFALGSNNLTISVADTGGDALPELRMNGLITGTGTLTFNNANTLPAGIGAPTNNESWGTLLITGNNAGFSGPVNIVKGRLIVNNDNGLGTGLVTVTGSLTNDNAGVLALGGNNVTPPAYGGLGALPGITLPNNIMLGGQVSGAKYNIGLYSQSGVNTISGLVTLTQATVNVQVNGLGSLNLSGGLSESVAGNSMVKSGNGLLIVNNGTFTGANSAVNGGNLAFTGTPLPGGTINIINDGNLNIGGAYPTLGSVLPRVAAASTGMLAITGANADTVSFQGYPTLGLGATAGGANFSGTLTPDNTTNRYRLGGGGGTLTVSGTNTLTGGNSVEIRNNPVILTGSNNYTGGTTLTNNTLTLAAAGAIGTSGTIVFSGGTLIFTAANTTDYSARFGTNLNQVYNLNTNGQDVTLASTFGSAGGTFNKTGAGTLSFGNGTVAASFAGTTVNVVLGGFTLAPLADLVAAGNVVSNNGNVSIAGALTANGELQMGQGVGSNTTVTVPNGGTITANNWTQVGRGGGTGTLNITGGTLTKNGGNAFVVGDRAGPASTGTINLSAGTINQTGGQLWIGQDGNDPDVPRATGTVNVSGGTFTVNSWLAVGREGGNGTLNISGGTFTKQGGDHTEIGGSSGATGIVNVTGGSFTGNGETRLGLSTAGSGTLTVSGSGFVDVGIVKLAFAGTGNGTINLNSGGILSVTRIEKSTAGNGIVNFGGGTLVAKGPSLTFMTGLTSANLNAGGVTIDTVANDITIGQNLLAGTGDGGVKVIGGGIVRLTGTGNTYTGPTEVEDGTLELVSPFLSDTSSVTIGTGTTLMLSYSGTDTVGSLTIDGNVIPAGTTVDAVSHPFLITGTGALFVAGGAPLTGYDGFKANPANNLTAGVNDGATQDPDFDGIPNLLEFVLGGLPNGAGSSNTSILPTVTQDATNLTVSFKRTDASETDAGLVLKVQWSADLVTWGAPKEIVIPATTTGIVNVAEDSPTPDRDTITVTIPKTGNEVGQKLFARVNAVR